MKRIVFKIYRYAFTYVCDEKKSTYNFDYYNGIACYSTAGILVLLFLCPLFVLENLLFYTFNLRMKYEAAFAQMLLIPFASIILGKFWIQDLFNEYEGNYVESLVLPKISELEKNIFSIVLILAPMTVAFLAVLPAFQKEVLMEISLYFGLDK